MNDVKSVILNTGIVAICRRIYGENLLRLSDALYKGGIKAMEITFDQSNPDCVSVTAEAISGLCSHHPDMFIGAGTVLNSDQVTAAAAAGASFIVSPDTNRDVISIVKKLGLISIPGAMTPTEILSAYSSGADIVKVFPASFLGTEYIKAVRSPISHVPLLAAGGITPSNLSEYISAGYNCAGISSYLSPADLINSGDWDGITARAENILTCFIKTK